MRRTPVPEVVKSVIGDEQYDGGWEMYMAGVRKAWRWERPFTDEEKVKVEQALVQAGYSLDKVKITRIPATGGPMCHTDLGNNCTYVWVKK